MLHKIFRLALLIVCVGFAAEARGQLKGDPKGAQAPPPRPVASVPPDAGRLDGARYLNDFFSFSVEIPEDWALMDAFTRDEVKRRSKDFVNAEGEEKKRQIDASIERTTILLSVSKHPPGSPQPFNANFSLIAERIPSAVIRNGTDVLRSMERVYRETQIDVKFQGGIREMKIDGVDFASATTRVETPAGVFMQRYYVTVRKSFALMFTYTYLDESDLAAFERIMKTVKFN